MTKLNEIKEELKNCEFLTPFTTVDRLVMALEKAIEQRNDALHDLYSDSEPDITNNMNKQIEDILSGKSTEGTRK